MTFTPNIPQSYQSPATNQSQMLGNFTAMNSIFGQDHYTFTAPSNAGKHRMVSFVGNSPAIAIPVTTSGITLLANSSGSHYTLSYVEHNGVGAGQEIQLTAKTTPFCDPNGGSFLPGSILPKVPSMGILIYWGMMPQGSSGINGNESADIFYDSVGHAAVFQGAPYSIVLTPLRPTGTGSSPEFVSSTTPPTDTSFRIINTSSTKHDVYWMAIGREKI